MAMFPHSIWKKSRLMECSPRARELFFVFYGALEPWGVSVYSRRAIVDAWCKDDDTPPPLTDGQIKDALGELERAGLIDFYEVDGVRYMCSVWYENKPTTNPQHPLPPWIKATKSTTGKHNSRRWEREVDIEALKQWRAGKSKPKAIPRPQKEEATQDADDSFPPTVPEVAIMLHTHYPQRYEHFIEDDPKSSVGMAQAFLDEWKAKGWELSPDIWEQALYAFADEQHKRMDGV